tara:strand:+ start:2142 stop:3050 length:909 start_codon:yes stop_codon:yes gene_type:complete
MEIRKEHFSFSQYNTWKTSPKEYFKKYVVENKYKSTKYQQFGKDLMESLEFDKEVGVVKGIPKELISYLSDRDFEEEFIIDGKSIGSKKNLLGFVDAISKDKLNFDEIKTGKHEWTQDMVDKNEQVLFYAMLIRMKYNVIPFCRLLWVETYEDEISGEVKFANHVEVFYRTFTISELDKFESSVLKSILDIEEYEHVILSFDKETDSKLLTLLSEKKRIDNELEVLKADMLISLRQEDTKYGVTENFDITKASRTTWVYSDSLKDKISTITKDFKKSKTLEEKNGTATQKQTEFLLIKARKL